MMTDNHAFKPDAPRKVAVLVLGMHRSGTSMLGGILDRLGCLGPKSLLAASASNPKGYFESPVVMTLNDEILKTLGSRWDDWRSFESGWQNAPFLAQFRERIAEVMASEYAGASLIYLKDPRICRLFPLWREVLVDIGYSPVCIHTHRNPVDVCESLSARDKFRMEPEEGMLVWLRHILDAEVASRGLPRIFTSYGQLLTDWEGVSDRAERVFGFSWPVLGQARESRVLEMVDPLLRHHDTSAESLLGNCAIPDLIKDCLQVMEKWADSGEDDTDRSRLDHIAERFDVSAELFGSLFAGLAAKHKMARANEGKMQTVTSELRERAISQQNELSALRQDKIALEQERDILIMQEKDAREDVRRASDHHMQLKTESDRAISDLQKKLVEADAICQTTKEQLDGLQQAHVALLEKCALSEIAFDETKNRMRVELEDQIQSLNAELTGLTATFVAREKTILNYKKEIAALQNGAKNLNGEIAMLRNAGAKLNEEIATLQNKVADQTRAENGRGYQGANTLSEYSDLARHSVRRVLRRNKVERLPEMQEVVASGFFDKTWYCTEYGISDKGDLALIHFMLYASHGYSPGPHFDCAAYLTHNPDVRGAGLNPLLHYIRYGRGENRRLK